MIGIIGAGVSGLTLAYALLKKGAQVTIVEADTIASGASGMATTYLEPRLGSTPTRLIEKASHNMWSGFAEEIERQSGIPVFFNKSGQIKVALEADATKLQTELNARCEDGQSIEILSFNEMQQLEPSLCSKITSAAFVSDVYWMNGKAFCEAIAECVQQMGASIVRGTEVSALCSEPTGIRAESADGESLMFEKIVFCNAMGRNRIEGVAEDVPLCEPVRGVTLVLDQSKLKDPLTRMIKHSMGHLCPQSDNRLIVGTTFEKGVVGRDVSSDTIELLYSRAEKIVPEVRNLPLIEVNSGLRAKARDGALKIGRSRLCPHQYFSLGHAGSGYLRAPVVMEALSTFILTGETTGPAAPIICS